MPRPIVNHASLLKKLALSQGEGEVEPVGTRDRRRKRFEESLGLKVNSFLACPLTRFGGQGEKRGRGDLGRLKFCDARWCLLVAVYSVASSREPLVATFPRNA